MFTPEKIEEWIQEVQKRPSSAPLIIQFIANRLSELNQWNEKLRAENLDLRSGARVDDYERQIAHLEYQLELLKRQVTEELVLDALPEIAPKLEADLLNLVIYSSLGQILRLEMDTDNLVDGGLVCQLMGFLDKGLEPPRLLVAPSTEELMLIFTSGRITTFPITRIPLTVTTEGGIDWDKAAIIEEPNIGETLACIAPISKMALADFFLQISRRGYIKKIRKALVSTIMGNQYIGTGVKVPADQTLGLTLNYEGQQFVLVSYKGYIQFIPDTLLPYAIVEAMRLGKADHLVATFPTDVDKSIIVMTQIGKVLHRTVDDLETAANLQRKGRMLYSTARREAGVVVVGAGAVCPNDLGLALHQDGRISVHVILELFEKGSLQVDGPQEIELLDFITFSVSNPATVS